MCCFDTEAAPAGMADTVPRIGMVAAAIPTAIRLNMISLLIFLTE
jgi:hypothetical protein